MGMLTGAGMHSSAGQQGKAHGRWSKCEEACMMHGCAWQDKAQRGPLACKGHNSELSITSAGNP